MSPNRNVQVGVAINVRDRTIARHHVPADGTRVGVGRQNSPGGRVAP